MDRGITVLDHTLKVLSNIQHFSTDQLKVLTAIKWYFLLSSVHPYLFKDSSDEGNAYLICLQINSFTTEI